MGVTSSHKHKSLQSDNNNGISGSNGSRSSRTYLRSCVFSLLPVVIGLGIWQVVAIVVPYARDLEPGSFPTPLDTFHRLWELVIKQQALLDYSIFAHTFASLWRWSIGFGIAAVLGILIGTSLGRTPVLHRALMPIVYVLQIIPGLAWIPVTILMFGLNDGATIFMIAMSAFAPMIINVAAGMRETNEAYISVAQMVGASRRMLFWRVLAPSSIPHILSGVRIALGNSWRVVVAAEMVVGTGKGLGYSIIQSRWTLDYASSFACIAVISIIGLLVEHFLIGRVEQSTVRKWSAMELG